MTPCLHGTLLKTGMWSAATSYENQLRTLLTQRRICNVFHHSDFPFHFSRHVSGHCNTDRSTPKSKSLIHTLCRPKLALACLRRSTKKILRDRLAITLTRSLYGSPPTFSATNLHTDVYQDHNMIGRQRLDAGRWRAREPPHEEITRSPPNM